MVAPVQSVPDGVRHDAKQITVFRIVKQGDSAHVGPAAGRTEPDSHTLSLKESAARAPLPFLINKKPMYSATDVGRHAVETSDGAY